MQSSTSTLPTKRSLHKNLLLVGNAGLFALSSGIAGMFVGAMVGIANYFKGPTWRPMGNGTLRASTLEETIAFCAVANGIWMSVLGLLVGLVLFLAVTGASSSWSPQHKKLFSQKVKTRLLLPLGLSIFIVPLLATALWRLWYGSFVSPIFDLGTAIDFTGMAMLPLGACLWTLLLVCSTRRPPKEPVHIGRLLPLD